MFVRSFIRLAHDDMLNFRGRSIQDFPEGGRGAATYYSAKISQKLHDNEEILAERV